MVVALRLGDDDHALFAVPVDAESNDVAGPHAVARGCCSLDVFGEDVAATDDDHVLDATAHDELAVEQIREVTGAQPVVVEEIRGEIGPAVVAGRHRSPSDLELAHLTIETQASRFG